MSVATFSFHPHTSCSNIIAKGTTEDFDSLCAVNLRGTFFCYKYAGLKMVSQGRGGRIIGASSLTGKQGWNHFFEHVAGWTFSSCYQAVPSVLVTLQRNLLSVA
jgi:NAD(P)-dependent dehydrogenase (short-subunit alcohol dehydrogenase family)